MTCYKIVVMNILAAEWSISGEFLSCSCRTSPLGAMVCFDTGFARVLHWKTIQAGAHTLVGQVEYQVGILQQTENANFIVPVFCCEMMLCCWGRTANSSLFISNHKAKSKG